MVLNLLAIIGSTLMPQLTLSLPIYWTNGKTTHFVGMNFFRNAHHFIKAKIKRDYHELIANQSLNCPKLTTFKTHYKLYYKSTVCDPSNVIALIEKFTLDGLIEAGVLTNDNVNFHLCSSWEVISQDKVDPRVEITLTGI